MQPNQNDKQPPSPLPLGFAQTLLTWYQTAKRDLPWRNQFDPYRIWISEVMCQQTRVEAVKGYYARFLRAFPTVYALAQANEEEVLKLWEGLGYYSRAKNLHAAAKQVVTQFGGAFPTTKQALLSLSGIGDYTASAIASIAFGVPTPAVDGNALRVVTRYLGWDADITKPPTKKTTYDLLLAAMPQGQAGDFNQAVMELGALVCIPNGAPHCSACPLIATCAAFAQKKTAALPVKSANKARKVEQRTVFIFSHQGNLAVQKRKPSGLLANLYELPNTPGHLSPQAAMQTALSLGVSPTALQKSITTTHIFTHIQWDMVGYYIACDSPTPTFVWATPSDLAEKIALPTAFRQFLFD